MVAGLLSITPGPDMAVVTRNALRSGRPASLAAVGGVAVGLVFWAAASVIGLAAVLRASPAAFTIVKLAGAAYLLFLGVSALWSLRAGATAERVTPHHRLPWLPSSPFRQGLLSNLPNPKIAVFSPA